MCVVIGSTNVKQIRFHEHGFPAHTGPMCGAFGVVMDGGMTGWAEEVSIQEGAGVDQYDFAQRKGFTRCNPQQTSAIWSDVWRNVSVVINEHHFGDRWEGMFVVEVGTCNGDAAIICCFELRFVEQQLTKGRGKTRTCDRTNVQQSNTTKIWRQRRHRKLIAMLGQEWTTVTAS